MARLTQVEARPQKYVKLRLTRDATVRQTWTEIVHHCVALLKANGAVVLTTGNTEGVHQMRITLRRLRTAARFLKPSLPDDQYTWVVAEAKWLMGELSAARAWDVFGDEFVLPMARRNGEQDGFDALVAAVARKRHESHDRAREAVGTERYTEFLSRLSARHLSQPRGMEPARKRAARPLDPIGDHCTRLLEKRDRAVRRLGRDVAELPEASLHDLRLRVKKLRYTVDFIDNLYPKKQVRAYRKHLTGLQRELGYLNDVSTASTLLRELSRGHDRETPLGPCYAGGLTIGWHRHAAIAARQSVISRVAAFLVAKPFWRGA